VAPGLQTAAAKRFDEAFTNRYNNKTGLAILCPITSHIKGYPFEFLIPDGLPIAGAVLSDQVKSLDWHARNAELIYTLPGEIVSEIVQKLGTLLSL